MKKMTPEKIGELIGKILAVGLVVAGLVALFSKKLTFGGIISWFMSAIGWWILGAVGLVLLILLLIMGFLWLLPILGFAAGIIGLILLFNGQTLLGIVLLIVGVVIAFKIGGWDDGL